MPLNIIEAVEPDQRHLIASGLVSVFRRYWAAFWGPRTEYLVRNAVLALLEAPGATLLDMSRLFVDDAFRAEALRHVRDPIVSRFWLEEYAAYPRDFRQEAIAPIQNKVGEFLLTPLIRNIVGQRRNLWHLRELMDSGKILVVNLSKGRIGEDTASLLGSLLLTRLLLAALSRQDLPYEERRPFFVYVDEFHSFATPSTYMTLLSEGRKFAVSIFAVNQFLSQLDDDLRSAIFGNVGTLISFRTGAEDAAYLSREFAGVVSADDLTGLDHHDIYLRLAVNGKTSAPFSGRTLCHPLPTASYSAEIIQRSRERYTRRRQIVEQGAERHYLSSQGVAMIGGNSRCSRPEPRRTPWGVRCVEPALDDQAMYHDDREGPLSSRTHDYFEHLGRPSRRRSSTANP